MELKDLETLENEFTEARNNLVTDRLDMSFGEIINMYQDREIIISPDFQRLFRWSDYQKTRFIESVLLGIPIPPIFVSENIEGKWELVDGLQRLSTIFSFFGILRDSEDNKDNEKNDWSLTEADIIKSLDGKKKEDLPLKIVLNIKRAVCRVEILRYNEKNNDLKYELFNRLNTGGSTATEQEIRNCIFRGVNNKFNDFLDKLSKNETLYSLILPSEQQEKEMFLQEIVLRFISLYYYSDNEELLKDNISKYMTNFMKKNVSNNEFNYEETETLFERLFSLLSKTMDSKVFRAGKGPFSTNLFDVITVGVAKYIDYYENKEINILKNKIEELKVSDDLKNTASWRVNSKDRNMKRIKLGETFFNPYPKNE
jgi:hypothetical protein